MGRGIKHLIAGYGFYKKNQRTNGKQEGDYLFINKPFNISLNKGRICFQDYEVIMKRYFEIQKKL